MTRNESIESKNEPIIIDFSEKEEVSYHNLWGFRTDEYFHFYYDESNNCRKFWIKPNDTSANFNTNVNDDFVLAGVLYEGDAISVDLDGLKKFLHLQANVKEIKFQKQFSSGSFIECMNKKRVGIFLKWIEGNGLVIHYSHVNNLYYAIVEIIDSIVLPTEIDEFGFDYLSIKSTFYKMLKGKEKSLQELMYSYCFPNVKKSEISGFCKDLLQLFDYRYELKPDEKFITGMISRAINQDELIFLHDNEDFVMQENYVDFYIDPIRTFTNSEHIFDEEMEIQTQLKQYHLQRDGKNVKNFRFVNSKDVPLVQISDVVAGIFGKLISYINSCDMRTLRNDVAKMNEIQVENVLWIDRLRTKADRKNRGFIHSITAQNEVDKLNRFIELVYAKQEHF